MADRTHVYVYIGGALSKKAKKALEAFIEAEADDTFIGPTISIPPAGSPVDAAINAGTVLVLEQHEASYGEWDSAEALLHEYGLHGLVQWGDGGSFGPGVRRIMPDGAAVEAIFHDSEVAISLSELMACTAQGLTMAQVIEDLQRFTAHALPPLTMKTASKKAKG